MATYRIASFGPMERLVRPFVPARPVLALERIPAAVAPAAEEAVAEWGGNTGASFAGDQNGDGFTVTPPAEEDDPDQGKILRFQEVGTREVTRVRIENPDNAAQWVEFDDPLTVTFRPPPELQRPPDEFWQLVFIDQSQV